MSRAQDITRALGGEWHGSQGSLPTPGHSRADRGITVKDTADGDVVFYCHNDSNFDWRPLKDECRRLGLLPERERSASAPWRETGHYEYVGADGLVAYRTVRLEKPGERKRFKAERPSPNGGWAPKIDGISRILYRLPDILAADPATPVYLVEGERKADKLASWGFVATTVAFGAKGWRDDYARALAGRTVVILPDNDQTGRAFAEKARASIDAGGGRAVVVDLPGLPPKGDIIDWNGTADELRGMAAEALSLGSTPADALGDLITVAASANVEPMPRSWLVDQLIPKGVTTLFGDGGVGKTLIAMQIGVAAEQGQPLFGFETARSAVLGLFCEDEKDELDRRFRAICRLARIDQSAVQSFHYQSRYGLDSLLGSFRPSGDFQPSPLLTALRERAIALGVRLIILDNVLHLFGGNINDPGQVTRFVAALNGLALDIDGAVLLLGHVSKSPGSEFAGSAAWSNASRSRLYLGRPGDLDPTPRSRITAEPGDDRILARLKANYAPISAPLDLLWYRGAFLQPEEVTEDPQDGAAGTALELLDNARFLECLRILTAQGRNVSHSENARNFAPKIIAAMPAAKGVRRERLKAAMERLFASDDIIANQPLWKGPDRKDVCGIALREGAGRSPANPQKSVQDSFAESRGKVREGDAENGGNPCGEVRSWVCPDTTYQSGVPLIGTPEFGREGREGKINSSFEDLR